MGRENLIYFGVIIALVIAVAAPFVASSNPDGLESAFFGVFGAKEVQGSDLDEEAAGATEEQVQEVTGNTFSFASRSPTTALKGWRKRVRHWSS